MPRNVEIKARISDICTLQEAVGRLSDSNFIILKQCDTFFHCNKGRLKLRETQNDMSSLIYYSRPNVSGPKLSDFVQYSTSDPVALKNILSASNGIKGVVRKTRYVYMIGQTRVHIDQVDGLGDFMELEVQLRDDQTTEDGQAICEDLMAALGITNDQLLNVAYMDLLVNGDMS